MTPPLPEGYRPVTDIDMDGHPKIPTGTVIWIEGAPGWTFSTMIGHRWERYWDLRLPRLHYGIPLGVFPELDPQISTARRAGLLPCPFCGGTAECVKHHHALPNGSLDTMYHVQCRTIECGVRTRAWYPELAALSSWNRRPHPTPTWRDP
jgi:Lar family restriction alleviation protein